MKKTLTPAEKRQQNKETFFQVLALTTFALILAGVIAMSEKHKPQKGEKLPIEHVSKPTVNLLF